VLRSEGGMTTSFRGWTLTIAALFLAAGSASAQQNLNKQATRSELQDQLAKDEHDSSSSVPADERDRRATDATTLRDRLANGDFQVGDRIVLYVANQPTLTDTFTVREGQILHLPGLADVSLHGVLRSELQGYLYVEISRYIRDPVVRSGSLLRLSVLGSVQRPGFYALPADMLLSDAIMHAGGLGNNADVQRTVVKRGGAVIWPAPEVQTVIKNGETLDQLNLRAGDEIDVGTSHPSRVLTIWVPVTAAAVGIITAIVLITRN
jgi:hypothetical protein